jgi:hypothetical protein
MSSIKTNGDAESVIKASNPERTKTVLDFGFWILDLESGIAPGFLRAIQNPKSKIQNRQAFAPLRSFFALIPEGASIHSLPAGEYTTNEFG